MLLYFVSFRCSYLSETKTVQNGGSINITYKPHVLFSLSSRAISLMCKSYYYKISQDKWEVYGQGYHCPAHSKVVPKNKFTQTIY